jgi:hypothetical protein
MGVAHEQGKTVVTEENLSQYHFVHNKFHMKWPDTWVA